VRAGLITGKGIVELLEFDDPVPALDGVVVDVALCGICGTDVHAYQSGRPYTPAICGHEWCGTVSAAGRDVRSISEGDRVVVAAPPACGQCTACLAGHAERCLTAFLVLVGRDPGAPKHGGFAPRIPVAASRVVATNAALTDEQAAQVEPATVAFHAVRHSRLRLGDTAVVQGAGPIGLSTLQFVRAAGAGRLIVIEPNPQRRELAAALGAHETVEPGASATDLVMDRTSGLGADVVFECVGRAPAIQTAVDLARRGGSVSMIGLPDENASINPSSWLIKEITITSSLAYFREEFEMAMAMIADGRVDVDRLHTSTVSLDQLDVALADLAGGRSSETKVLVDPRR
jgi:(R,R)-butanediol dehydrogenase/meso-butanediol dehydrogenase/diacetyl reductase